MECEENANACERDDEVDLNGFESFDEISIVSKDDARQMCQ